MANKVQSKGKKGPENLKMAPEYPQIPQNRPKVGQNPKWALPRGDKTQIHHCLSYPLLGKTLKPQTLKALVFSLCLSYRETLPFGTGADAPVSKIKKARKN